MIEMFVESNRLVLTDDVSVRVELNSPVFETDTIPASVVYQFDVPERDNEQIFGYANHIEVLGKFREYNWRMNYAGIHMFSGKLIVLSVSGGKFRCAATLMQLSVGFSDKKLTEFNYQPCLLVPIGSNITSTYFIPGIEHDTFCLPKIYAPDLYPSNPAWSGYVNRFPDYESHSFSEAAIPCFKVFKIIEELFKNEGFVADYTSSKVAVDLDLFWTLIWMSNHTLDTEPATDESENVSVMNLSYYQNVISPSDHVPPVSVSDVMVALKQMFTCFCFIDNRSKVVQFILAEDIFKSKYIDLSDNVLDDFEVLINEPKSYTLHYDSDELKNIPSITPEYKTLAFAPTPWRVDQFISIRAVNSFYKSALMDDFNPEGDPISVLQWTRAGDSFRPVRTNTGLTGSEDININACPSSMIELYGEFLPYFKDAGVSARFNPEASPLDKMVFFYSWQNNGTSSDVTPGGGIFPYPPSLKLDGANGLFAQILKSWYDFIEGANEYTFDLKVTVEDMLNIIPVFGYQNVQTQLQVRKIRVKNQVYIPKQFTFELTHSQIKCQAKLMKDDSNK